MRLPPLLLLIFLLLVPTVVRAGNDTSFTPQGSPHAAQTCAAMQGALTSLGRPTPDARLLASATAQSAPVSVTAGPVVHVVRAGETLSKIAVQYHTTVYALMNANGLRDPNLIHRGQQLIIPGASAPAAPPVAVQRLSAPFADAWVEGEVVQGDAALIWLRVTPGTTVNGKLGEQRIPFRTHCDLLWGLVAFDALRDEAGTQTLSLFATTPDGLSTTAFLGIPLRAGNFWTGPMITYPPDKRPLQEPTLVRSENERLWALFASIPDGPARWSGPFHVPINTVVTGGFGSRGTINGGPPVGYHEGVDYRARTPTSVHAPAPGVVILAEPLTVRGTTIYLDHGAGVATGYFHLSELRVEVGDTVATGDVLGMTGKTGLVTGPHLHWEMRVNGRWSNPVPWLYRNFP